MNVGQRWGAGLCVRPVGRVRNHQRVDRRAEREPQAERDRERERGQQRVRHKRAQ